MAEPQERRELLKRAIVRIEQLEAELEAERRGRQEPLAVVGIGCRFPGGANDPDRFWELLLGGFDATGKVPSDRFDIDTYFDADPDAPGKTYTRCGAFIDEPIDRFDPAFFGIAPREADEMDPQQRLLLEVVWEALERGGIQPARLQGSSAGVFLGMSAHDWLCIQDRGVDLSNVGTYYGTGIAHSVAAGRISYVLGLRGPAITIDTACSSALVAFHAACQSLRSGETRFAIAAGASLILSPNGHVVASKGRMLSPDGRCKTFDASADGYGRGEGCGVVLLKRLGDARADGNRILALVHGTATNQDGRSGGLTAPNGRAQEEVIRAAIEASGLDPSDIDYIEAHGTGTELGDPIEIQALGAVLASRPSERPLHVGSVKTNIGHLESTAGIAGVIKAVLALQKGVIPPHLNFHTPNPHIEWDRLPFLIPRAATPWPVREGGRRVAGVSSFGFSGTNAHVILESYPEQVDAEPVRNAPVAVPISARTSEALSQLARRLSESIRKDDAVQLAGVAATLASGRNHWEHRAAPVVADRTELLSALDAIAAGRETVQRAMAPKRAPRVAFLFTGQGSQRPGMGRELLEREPVFRQAIERCDSLLAPRLGRSLIGLLKADPDDADARTALDHTSVTQPALFALEWSLSELWRSWGIEPSVVLGHSVGEYVAACVAGVMGLEDALALVSLRARLMGSLPAGGGMAAVFAPEERVRPHLARFADWVSLAALNSPANTVISGDASAVDCLLELLAAEGIDGRRLLVSHAFHSHLMEPVLDEFRDAAAAIRFHEPKIDIITNRDGALAKTDTFGPDYWARHIRDAVQFAPSIDTLRSSRATLLLEIGPAPVLLSLARACPGAPPEEKHVLSLKPGVDAGRTMHEALASIYQAGLPVDWSEVLGMPRPPLELPTYPFQRQRHWLSARKASVPAGDTHPLLGRRIESPRLREHVFETILDEEQPSWIGQHRVFGRAILPAAAFIEAARAAVSAVQGSGYELSDIEIHEALAVEGERTLQTLVDAGNGKVEICSRAAPGGAWRTHLTARITTAAPVAIELDGWPLVSAEEFDTAGYLEKIRASGVEHGEMFRGLARIRSAAGRAEGEIDVQRIPEHERRRYGIHPAILDAAFQLCGACLNGSGDSGAFLPVAVNQVRGEMPDDSRISARTVLREGGPDSAALVCDIVLTGAKSGKVLNIIGLRFQKAEAPRRSVEQRVSGWLYTTAWVDLEIPPVGAEGGEWRIVGTGADAEAIAGALRARGRTAVVQTSAERLDDGASVAGIVLVASPARQLDADSDINAELRRSLEPLLRLAHHAAGQPTHGRICVVTRGACAGDDEATITNPVATAAWGLGQTIAVEMPGWGCRRIDLEADAPHAPDAIADAILMNGAEDRLLLRKGRWRAARLVRVEGEPRKVRPAPDYRLDIAERGQLGALTLAPHTLEPLRADAVRIRVEATGLNFRDVLNALGMYPGDAGPLGNECAGTVEAVGASVRGLEPGDRVVAITPRGFCSRVDAPALLAVRVPDGIPSGAAATIPIAFLTADWALNELAHMRAGERVLIHAGAGGVGMAAVQLAARAGAEIHATVGSRRKREVLRRMGVRHIYDSRSLSFRDEILHNTNGEGVHIVLNSLADDFIPASLDVLRQDGRFLEIGKTGVWDAERVRTVRPDADYHVIYLGEACEQDPVRVRERFVGLMESFASGELQPLPVRRFMVDDAAAAFRFMAQARHIGKVVLFDSTEAADAPDDGAVWITGGLGGIGLVIAADLARRGYRKLALSGRSDPTPEAGTRLQEIRDLGAEVLLVRCDVSHRSHVLRARETIEERGWSIRHVLHSAGVLDDGTLPSLTWPRFETVLAPKALGAWNLHLVTADLPLESFVLFSAGAALLGSPGQANYAAANAFLDGLAELRRAIGLPAQSIAWGAWAEVGMAARAGLDWSSRGMDTIDLEGGAAALNRLRREADVSAAVLPMDWRRLFGSLPEGLVPGLLQDLHAEVMGEPGQGAGLSESDGVCLKPGELALLTPDERVARLGEYIRATLGRVLGIRPEQLGMETEIGYLGFDSLMATEVRNRIEADLNVLIPTRHLLDSPSASRLALEISTRMDAGVSGNGSGTPVAWTEGEI